MTDNKPDIISLFTGYGGLDTAARQVLGGRLAAVCDNDPAAAAVLTQHHPDVPNLGDITTVDWHDLAARLDPHRTRVITGGFPCQDVSAAGHRAGMTPESRSGLWAHMARAIAVLEPDLVVIENVRGLLYAPAHRDMEPEPQDLGNRHPEPVLRALGAVLGDLASLGFDARWCGLRAADVGAPHSRYRLFILARPAADTASDRRHQRQAESDRQPREPDAVEHGAAVPDTDRAASDERRQPAPGQTQGWGPRADACRRDRTPTAHPESVRCATRHLASGDTTQRPVTDRDRVPAWGSYRPAIDRWAHVVGRDAPEPTEPGRRSDNHVLSARFVEWLMGLPAGHVTDTPGLTRNEQLRLLGNGVVPQQATAAVHHLLTSHEETAS